MKYVGLDVHLKATVWCCLDETGEVVARGKAATTAQGLEESCSDWERRRSC